MPRPLILMSLLLTLALANGCQVMSKTDCKNGDWYGQGQDDSQNGYRKSMYQEHRKVCQEHGFPTNEMAYKNGYKKGLNDYCTFDKGLHEGKKEKRYKNICPKNLEPSFLKGYALGREIAEQERELEERRKKQEEEQAQALKEIQEDHQRAIEQAREDQQQAMEDAQRAHEQAMKDHFQNL